MIVAALSDFILPNGMWYLRCIHPIWIVVTIMVNYFFRSSQVEPHPPKISLLLTSTAALLASAMLAELKCRLHPADISRSRRTVSRRCVVCHGVRRGACTNDIGARSSGSFQLSEIFLPHAHSSRSEHNHVSWTGWTGLRPVWLPN